MRRIFNANMLGGINMYCPKCGSQNDDNVEFCTSCGNSLKNINTNQNPAPMYNNYQQINYQHVPNYLAWSIVTTLLCCLPLGIPAIVYSSQVDSKLRNGDYEGAVNSSKKAKMWCWIAFGVGLAVGILYFIFVVLMAGLGEL